MHSHLPSGENSISRAPMVSWWGIEILETLKPSSGLRDRRWKSLMSTIVETARILPSELSAADVIFASPLTSILATNFFDFVAGSSSSISDAGFSCF